ncbi:MAG: hypothetical protein WC693_03730 [Patescibacteria group bacterium]
MKKVSFIAIMLLAVALVAGAGCTKKASENAAENILEESTGGDADVDIDDNTVRINVNGSSMEAGDNVSLPADFPSDIYVADGDLKSSSKTAENSFSVTIETTKSVSEMQTEYETELANDGWNVNTSLAFEGMVTLGGEKNDRMVTVSISVTEGKTWVIIATAQTE